MKSLIRPHGLYPCILLSGLKTMASAVAFHALFFLWHTHSAAAVVPPVLLGPYWITTAPFGLLPLCKIHQKYEILRCQKAPKLYRPGDERTLGRAKMLLRLTANDDWNRILTMQEPYLSPQYQKQNHRTPGTWFPFKFTDRFSNLGTNVRQHVYIEHKAQNGTLKLLHAVYAIFFHFSIIWAHFRYTPLLPAVNGCYYLSVLPAVMPCVLKSKEPIKLITLENTGAAGVKCFCTISVKRSIHYLHWLCLFTVFILTSPN